MGQFTNDLTKFEVKTGQKLTLAGQKIALEAFSRVILRTPVDKGRARGSWQVQIGSVPTGTIDLNDKTGAATISKVQAAASGMEAGDVIYLASNLPYIMRLEDGYSGQAPAGMVGLTVQEIQNIANQVGLELIRI